MRSDHRPRLPPDIDGDADNVTIRNNYTVCLGCSTTSISDYGARVTDFDTNCTSSATSAFADSTPETTYSDFRLGAASTAAVDRGTAPSWSWYSLDQRTTPANGNGVGGAEYDCGAFEYAP